MSVSDRRCESENTHYQPALDCVHGFVGCDEEPEPGNSTSSCSSPLHGTLAYQIIHSRARLLASFRAKLDRQSESIGKRGYFAFPPPGSALIEAGGPSRVLCVVV